MKFTSLVQAAAFLTVVAAQNSIAAPVPSLENNDIVDQLDPENRMHVIYGDDNRLDLFQVSDPAQLALADSTVALLSEDAVRTLDSSFSKILGSHFGVRRDLCLDEPFYEQTSAAFCSGSLVAPDVVMTAGHCITSEFSCQDARFVFGFGIRNAGDDPTMVQTNDVYTCKRLIQRAQSGDGVDFALIQLDRPVPNHQPLALNTQSVVSPGEELIVIGHPSGLPTKVAGGANVRHLVGDAYFVANLDTYGGNSGSAVFNARTHEIEGILVRGETDFTSRGVCTVSNRCESDDCRGEDVTLVSQVLPFLPQQ